MKDLTKIKCVPCEGGMSPMSEEKILLLMGSVEGWARAEERIEKTFAFKDFPEALIFFNKVAEIAEEEGHHPDMGIKDWNKVNLSLTTHAAKGLTINDFVVAAKVNDLLG